MPFFLVSTLVSQIRGGTLFTYAGSYMFMNWGFNFIFILSLNIYTTYFDYRLTKSILIQVHLIHANYYKWAHFQREATLPF